jgi:hypothetical protein
MFVGNPDTGINNPNLYGIGPSARSQQDQGFRRDEAPASGCGSRPPSGPFQEVREPAAMIVAFLGSTEGLVAVELYRLIDCQG